jgi:hypothetical protein
MGIFDDDDVLMLHFGPTARMIEALPDELDRNIASDLFLRSTYERAAQRAGVSVSKVAEVAKAIGLESRKSMRPELDSQSQPE